jgi:hypothetical protein
MHYLHWADEIGAPPFTYREFNYRMQHTATYSPFSTKADGRLFIIGDGRLFPMRPRRLK